MSEWCTYLLLYLVRPLPTSTSRQHMVLSSVMLSHAWTGFLVKLGLFIFTIVILLFWMGRNAAFLLILLNTSSVRIVHGCAHITGTFSRNFLRRYNQYMIPYYIAVHIFLDLVWIQNNRALRTFRAEEIFRKISIDSREIRYVLYFVRTHRLTDSQLSMVRRQLQKLSKWIFFI